MNNEFEQAYIDTISPKKQVSANPQPPYLILKNCEYLLDLDNWTNKVDAAKKFDTLQDAVNMFFELLQKYPEYQNYKIKIVGLADAEDF